MLIEFTSRHVSLSSFSDRFHSFLLIYHVQGSFIYDFMSVQGLVKLSILVLFFVCLINFVLWIERQGNTVHFHIVEHLEFIEQFFSWPSKESISRTQP